MKRTSAAAGGVIAVVVSLAIVVLASRGDPGDRTAAAFESGAVGRTIFLSVLGVAFAISAVLAVWALWPDGSSSPRPAPRFRWLPYIAIAVLILVLAVFAPERPRSRAGRDGAGSSAAPAAREAETATEFVGRASPTASLALTAVAVAALVTFTMLLRRRRDDPVTDALDDASGDERGAPSPLSDDLVAAIDAGDLDRAIDAVAGEADPRRAVLLAYAVLDARLSTTTAARPRTSTPHEWLQRIRKVHGTTAPEVVDGARRLTSLYEQARFGNSVVSSDDRADAAAALRTLHQLPTRHRTR